MKSIAALWTVVLVYVLQLNINYTTQSPRPLFEMKYFHHQGLSILTENTEEEDTSQTYVTTVSLQVQWNLEIWE